MTPQTLTAQDLAEILHLNHRTVINRVNANPESLPPPIRLPGNKQPLWLPQDVQAWLESHRVSA